MIAKLRKGHRILFPVLGVLIIVIAILGLQENPEYSNSELPGYENFSSNNFLQNTVYSIEWDKRGLAQLYIVNEKTTSDYYLHTSSRSSIPSPHGHLFYFNKDGSDGISESSLLIGKYLDKDIYYTKIPSEEITDSKILLYHFPSRRLIALGSIVKRESSE